SAGMPMSDIWTYQPSANTWASVGAANSPQGRSAHGAVWNTINNQMLVLGGLDGANVLNDLWSYRSSGGWSRLSAEVPSGRMGHSSIWDPVAGQMLTFGGASSTDGVSIETLN